MEKQSKIKIEKNKISVSTKKTEIIHGKEIISVHAPSIVIRESDK